MEYQLKDLSIYYEIHGTGRPIVMIHGFFPDHRLMKGCMEPLFKNRKGWQRIYFDLPGMGQTKSRPWIQNSDQMLEVVNDFIDAIIPNQHFLLAGQSYGGYLARAIVQKKAELVDGLLLICPVVLASQEKRILPQKTILFRDETLVSRLPKEELEAFESIAVIETPEIWERFRKEVFQGIKIADEPFLNNIAENGYGFSFDPDVLEGPFNKPSLFITGCQDYITGYRDAWRLINNYPHCSFIVLDRAGHNLQIEQESLFNESVSKWLDRVGF